MGTIFSPHLCAQISIPAPIPGVPEWGCGGEVTTGGQPSTEVKLSLPQPLLAAESCTAGLLSLGDKPTALGRQVPAEPPTLQIWVNPLKGMLHEL